MSPWKSPTPSLAVLTLSAGLLWVQVGGAEPVASKAGERRPPETKKAQATSQTHEIEINAGQVTMERPFTRLVLSKGVELRVHRYRLKADNLQLSRSGRGVEVEGKGEVSFCACDNSPFTAGFEHATVAPPTDLFLQDVTLRACGVPFFWSPIFWVRSPSRLGLLAPRFAYRGNDGFWTGSGVHVPLSVKTDPSHEFVDLSLGGYAKGGWDLGGQLVTTNTVTSARWDWLDHGLVQVDAWGHRDLGTHSAVNWRADALRQARSRSGPVSFDAATRRYDRNRLEAVSTAGPWLVAAEMFAYSPRASRLTVMDGRGAGVRVGAGTSVGEVGRAQTGTWLRTESSAGEASYARLLHSGELGFDARPGPFALAFDARERWSLGQTATSLPAGGVGETEVRLSLPLVRRWRGERGDGIAHWLEPEVGARALVEKGWLVPDDRRLSMGHATTIGLRTIVGRPASAEAARLDTKLGIVSHHGRKQWAGMAAPVASGKYWGLGGELGWGGGREWVSTVRARAGRTDQLNLDFHLEGRGSSRTRSVRWLMREGWEAQSEAFRFDKSGWLAGSGVGVPIGRVLAIRGGSEADLAQRRWLATRLQLAYRHGCGCAAATIEGGQRLGREGWDLGLIVDFMPK